MAWRWCLVEQTFAGSCRGTTRDDVIAAEGYDAEVGGEVVYVAALEALLVLVILRGENNLMLSSWQVASWSIRRQSKGRHQSRFSSILVSMQESSEVIARL